jgi:hypothetical protein
VLGLEAVWTVAASAYKGLHVKRRYSVTTVPLVVLPGSEWLYKLCEGNDKEQKPRACHPGSGVSRFVV